MITIGRRKRGAYFGISAVNSGFSGNEVGMYMQLFASYDNMKIHNEENDEENDLSFVYRDITNT